MEVSLDLMVFILPNYTLKPLSYEDVTINEGLVWNRKSGSLAAHSVSCPPPLLFDFELSLKRVCIGKSKRSKFMLAIQISGLEGKLPVLRKWAAGVCHDVKAQTIVCFSSINLCCLLHLTLKKKEDILWLYCRKILLNVWFSGMSYFCLHIIIC